MNTNALKRFATTSRNLLIKGVQTRLRGVGFNEDGSVVAEPTLSGNVTILYGNIVGGTEFYNRWQELRRQIERHGVKEVVEQAAYTWFNRFMAIRILDRNNLAPDILQYENHEVRLPKIVTDARAGKTPVLNEAQQTALNEVIFDGSKTYEQFSVLIQAYCENNAILRSCFGGITDYTMLLLPPDILGEGNFIDLLNETSSFIDHDDYRKPELIGWLYQFYIADKKDIVMAKKGGYESDEIPAATQIFTPNWIVKYMVENTLGRIYLDNNPGTHLAENWKYLVNPVEPTPSNALLRYSSLEQLTCADLSCGSGHILNEMFDLLYQLYEEEFYSPREAIEAIFRKNMVGIDIDVRAQQLAMFALLLKACQRDSAFTDGHCLPRIYSFPDVWPALWEDTVGHFNCAYQISMPQGSCGKEIVDAFSLMKDADVLGSIMKFEISKPTRDYLSQCVSAFEAEPKYEDRFLPIINAYRIILALTEDYAALVSNPPYMPTSRNHLLAQYAKKTYPDTKADLFAVFIELMLRQVRAHGRIGVITMESWMFLSSFENMRKNILDEYFISSLAHFGWHIIGIAFGTVMAIIEKSLSNERKGEYSYLTINDINREINVPFIFPKKDNGRYSIIQQKQFEQIPGSPIAYWVSKKTLELFKGVRVGEIINPRHGLATSDNDRFLKRWFEINANTSSLTIKCQYDKKWFPINKGGKTRKWFGNNEWVINYENDGAEIKDFAISLYKSSSRTIQNTQFYFKPGLTWNALSSGNLCMRWTDEGFIFGSGAHCAYAESEEMMKYGLGYLNSNVFQSFIAMLSPTLNYNVDDIRNCPFIEKNISPIATLVNSCISISRQDWDAHETSWDFETNPLLAVDERTYFDNIDWMIEKHRRATGEEIAIDPAAPKYNSLEWRYNQFCQKWECLFDTLHRNEEEINRRFIEIYGLQDELNPHVEYEDITILQNGEISLYRPTHAMEMYQFTEEEKQNYIKAGGRIEGDMVIAFQSLITWNKDVIIKQLISYAVGCMMGRYRLDRPGLAIAHPNPSAEEIAEYIVPQTGKSWWIDDDGIVPMMDDDCGFHDNASNRFSEFIEAAFGTDSKTENLNFVREALGKDIVDYLRTNFYADHKKMYQNRPIYWMFSSNQKGKRAAFQCLVYMHRMNRFTPEHIRTNYLLPYIETLAAREADLSSRTSLTARENKQLKQIKADLEECREYQLRLHDFADQQIEIELDDGVVKNYAIFAPVLTKLK